MLVTEEVVARSLDSFGEILALCDRAMFFACKVDEESGVSFETLSTEQNKSDLVKEQSAAKRYSLPKFRNMYLDLKQKAECLDEEESQKIYAAFITEINKAISDLLALSRNLLDNRLLFAVAEYKNRYQVVLDKKLIAAERGPKDVDASKGIVLKRYRNLIRDVNLRIEKDRKEGDCAVYDPEWELLKSRCCLLMEEISYLNQRVDEFQRLIKENLMSWLNFWALCSAVVGALVAVGALCYNVRSDTRNSKSNLELGGNITDRLDIIASSIPSLADHNVVTEVKTVSALLSNIDSSLDVMKPSLTNVASNRGNAQLSIRMAAITNDLEGIAKALETFKTNSLSLNDTQYQGFLNRMISINNEVSNLNHSITEFQTNLATNALGDHSKRAIIKLF